MSTRRECKNCGKLITDFIPFCPNCGEKQPAPMSEDEIGRDPFSILQISPDAEEEVIEAAYRSLAKKYHPDSSGKGETHDRMKEINWAYSVLKDPQKRSEWSKKRSRQNAEKENKSQASYKASSTSSQKYGQDERQNVTKDVASKTQYRRSSPPRSQIEPVKPWQVIAVVVVLFAVSSIIYNSTSENPSSSGTLASASNRSQLHPTITPRPIPTRSNPTRTAVISHSITNSNGAAFNCIHWSRVNSSSVHRSINDLECVYGTVKRILVSDVGQYILFSDQPGTFRIYGYKKWINIRDNTCVAVIGAVYGDNPSFLYITLDWGNTEVYTFSGC